MKLFFDMKFTGLHQNTTLISIGIVTEDGEESFYAEFSDYNKSQVDDWIKENAIKELAFYPSYENADYTLDINFEKYYGDKKYIKEKLLSWLSGFEEIEFWGDCLSYDWVLLNELWGGALNKPDNVYFIPFDICTLFKVKGIDPDISRVEFTALKGFSSYNKILQHFSLHDAEVIRKCYNILMEK